jgi:hypothetical protein
MPNTDKEQLEKSQTQTPDTSSEGDSSRWAEDEGVPLKDSDIEDVSQTYPEKQDEQR